MKMGPRGSSYLTFIQEGTKGFLYQFGAGELPGGAVHVEENAVNFFLLRKRGDHFLSEQRDSAPEGWPSQGGRETRGIRGA